MPMDRKRYPSDWKRIATEVKEAADWKCQNCGKQCRRPGEPFDTHKRTLTVAHLNHTPEDVRRENLQALCAPCHLRYDAQHHAETRRKKAMQDAVSRRAVRKMVCNHCGRIDCEDGDNCSKMTDLEKLPSAVQKPKTGEWLYHTYMPHKKYCSKCGKDSPYDKLWDFCPKCGAWMSSAREE